MSVLFLLNQYLKIAIPSPGHEIKIFLDYKFILINESKSPLERSPLVIQIHELPTIIGDTTSFEHKRYAGRGHSI